LYLTAVNIHIQIPDTDAECRWDWRSLRCEPACNCHFDWQGGDYHLGRSCRLKEEKDDSCVAIDPSQYLLDMDITKRILSLTTQSIEIAQDQTRQTSRKVVLKAIEQVNRMQESVCAELWTLYKDLNECLPADEVPVKTIPEKLLCGPIKFDVCAEDKVGLDAEKLKRPVFPSDLREAKIGD
jgi:hypothetical protein